MNISDKDYQELVAATLDLQERLTRVEQERDDALREARDYFGDLNRARDELEITRLRLASAEQEIADLRRG